MAQSRDMHAQGSEWIFAQCCVSVMVERGPGRLTDEAERDILHQCSQNHDRGTECLSSGQDVQLLPRLIVLAFDELVDHRCHIATVPSRVVAQVDDQATGLDFVYLS